MIRPLGSSLSGFTASLKLLDAASMNIANCQTGGYKAKSVSFKETAGGVSASVSTVSSPGPVFELGGRVFEGSNVLLVSEMVNLLTARRMFSLNAAAFRTAAEMEESAVDLIA